MRWIDGCMSESERTAFEQRLAAEPTLSQQAARMQQQQAQLRQLLLTYAPLRLEPASPEFFQRSILQKIEEESQPASPRRASASGAAGHPSESLWTRWMRSWFAPVSFAGAAAAAAFFFLRQAPSAGEASHTHLVSSWSPEMQAAPAAYFSEEAQAQVIDLQGITAYPDDRSIASSPESSPDAHSNRAAVVVLAP